jgi:hypothetical protein
MVSREAQPLRIETTRRVVLNTMFKKPGGAGAVLYIWGKPPGVEASRGGE